MVSDRLREEHQREDHWDDQDDQDYHEDEAQVYESDSPGRRDDDYLEDRAWTAVFYKVSIGSYLLRLTAEDMASSRSSDGSVVTAFNFRSLFEHPSRLARPNGVACCAIFVI